MQINYIYQQVGIQTYMYNKKKKYSPWKSTKKKKNKEIQMKILFNMIMIIGKKKNCKWFPKKEKLKKI